MNDFVVTGVRPASANDKHRPSSADRKCYGYHTLTKPSYIDESLFGSQHQTRLDEELHFKAPWEYPKPQAPRKTFAPPPPKIKSPLKPERRGRPLFWSPTPGEATHKRPKTGLSSNSHNGLWNTRDHFRRLKHTPTYVDESLFGPRLQEPTFEAPWNERKKGEKKPVRPYLFDPTCVGRLDNDMPTKRSSSRPASALGLCRESRGRKSQGSGNPQPVWKP